LDYKRIITVSPADSDTPTDNGQRLLDAVNSLGSSAPLPSAADPYEIFVEPGTYDLNGQALQLPSDVYLVGAHEDATTITSDIGNSEDDATVEADGGPVGIADLTVTNTNDGGQSVAVAVSGGTASLEQLNLEALGTNSTNVGLAAYGGDVTADRVTASASNSTFDDFGAGLLPFSGTPTLVATDSLFTASQAGTQDGASGLLYAQGTTARIADSQLSGSDGPTSPDGGNLTCVDDYNGNFSPLDSSCG
jgi:hypothetical protein